MALLHERQKKSLFAILDGAVSSHSFFTVVRNGDLHHSHHSHHSELQNDQGYMDVANRGANLNLIFCIGIYMID